MQEMEDLLSLEIKKEMADRYFGFRKMIEDNRRQYDQGVLEAYRQLEDRVGFELIRLYLLLHQEPLIHDFFRLTGLRDHIFFDPYLLSACTIRHQLFAGQRSRGLTRRSRFRHIFFDVYNRLVEGIAVYRTTLNRLTEEGEIITQEIGLFHRKNDVGAMMGFLRGLNTGSVLEDGLGAGGVAQLRDNSLEQKLRIEPPVAAEHLLPNFPALPLLKTCQGALQVLVDAAYEAQGKPDIREWVS